MGRRYQNPPLVEAVCEFRLTQDTNWDMTIPGLLYEKVRNEFPHREQRLIQEIDLTQSPEGIQQQIRTSERILLFSENRNIFVQLGPRLIAINSVKPYPSWAGFKPKIEKAFDSLSNIIEVKGLQRIGLRYINRIEISGFHLKLEDYFQFYLFLGPQLPQELASFIAGGEFNFANGRDRCRVQLGSIPVSITDSFSVHLDIDYFLFQEKGVKMGEAIEWVDKAHDRVEEVFEGCINDRLREMFKEVKQDASIN
jgi:uncharacterized protein (TIGR04255 family)